MRASMTVLILVGLGCGSEMQPLGSVAGSSGGSVGSGGVGGTSGSSGSGGVGGSSGSGGVGGSSGTGGVGGRAVDLYQSGTRLKMRVGTTPDGAKMFLGWRDTLQNEDCTFTTAGDHSTRCLPAGQTLIGSLYSDASCTVPVIAWGTCESSSAPTLARKNETSQDACGRPGTVARIFSVGSAYIGATYFFSGPNCVPWQVTGFSFFSVGTEVDPVSFVQRTETVE